MRGFAGASALVIIFALSAARAAPPPAEVFGRLPAVDGVAISPDGTKLVVQLNSGDISAMRVVSAADGSPVGEPKAAGLAQRIRSVGWAQDDIVKFVFSQTLTSRQATPPGYMRMSGPAIFEYFRAGTLTVADGGMRIMLNDFESAIGQPTLADLLAPIEGDPGYGRMTAYTSVDSDAKFALFRVNLANGHGNTTRIMSGDTASLLLDKSGDEYARIEDIGDNFEKWHLYVANGGKERLLRDETSDSGEARGFEGILYDGRIVRMETPAETGLSALNAVDPATGKDEFIYEIPKYDVEGGIEDPWTHEIVGAAWIGEFVEQQHFFDPQLEKVRLSLAAPLRSGNPELMSWSRDRSRFVVYDEAPGDVGTFYLFEPASRSLKRLARMYPEIAAGSLGATAAITYPARDGKRVPAYMTLPPGADPKNLPTVVLVHGGPSARDSGAFDWWAQFLASRGYLVLQPQFRGSTGYGSEWETAGYKEWGGLMQTDVEDGATALIANGFADPAKICIVGASYGGYAALAGATLTPNRYACAVSVAGVSDINLLFHEVSGEYGDDSAPMHFWRKTIGDEKARDHLKAVSPVTHAADVRIPILLLHGTHDTVVPIEQTQAMYDKLRRAGKTVTFTELPGDDHWLSYATTRIKMLQEVETFLARYVPAAPPVRTSQNKAPEVAASAFAGSALLEAGGHTPVLLPLAIRHNAGDPPTKLPD